MSTVISDNKHYEDMSTKIRTILQTDNKYKPSEIPQAILSMTNNAEDYSTFQNGAMFNSDSVKISGTKLSSGIFAGCSIKTIEIPETITSIPKYAFFRSDVEEIILHDNITSFGSYSFYYCKNLKHINLPKNLRSIGYYSLSNLNIEDNIVIPNTVTTIEDDAFLGSDFTGIDLPSSVGSVGYAALYSCMNLKTLVIRVSGVLGVDEHKKPLAYSDIASGEGYIYVPSSLIDSYKSNTYWSQYANQFRALEDYTIDGTTTGEFDFSRV